MSITWGRSFSYQRDAYPAMLTQEVMAAAVHHVVKYYNAYTCTHTRMVLAHSVLWLIELRFSEHVHNRQYTLIINSMHLEFPAYNRNSKRNEHTNSTICNLMTAEVRSLY